MKKLLLSGLLVVGLVMAGPSIASACSQKSSKCFKCAQKAEKCKISKLKKKVKMLWVHKDALGITDDQLDKIKDIKHDAIKKLIHLKADKEIVAVDLKSAMWEENMDLGVINKLIDVKYGAKATTAKTYAKAVNDIKKVLSEEQRSQWREMAIQAKLSGSSCPKCAASGSMICPITGKVLGDKGSMKGSSKGSMQ